MNELDTIANLMNLIFETPKFKHAKQDILSLYRNGPNYLLTQGTDFSLIVGEYKYMPEYYHDYEQEEAFKNNDWAKIRIGFNAAEQDRKMITAIQISLIYKSLERPLMRFRKFNEEDIEMLLNTEPKYYNQLINDLQEMLIDLT